MFKYLFEQILLDSMAIDITNISDTIVAFVPIMILISVVGWILYAVRKNL